jgi:hypothetical protein
VAQPAEISADPDESATAQMVEHVGAAPIGVDLPMASKDLSLA